jgi:2'-hydroxyisoflavone reductase
MKLLIIGGTIFVGRALVEAAQQRGHEVTLFNRGKHNPDLYPEVEKLRGDREQDLTALEGRHWDAVIDTCGYAPRVVRASAEKLADSVGHYTFISSISVYSDFSQPGMDESGPLGTLENPDTEEVTGETYGPLKVLCEQAAEQAMPGRVLNIRPGLIVGPHDLSDRFTYWPRRIAQGGDVLAPDDPNLPVQFIDARDLAEWNLRMVEAGKTGIYNATGPDYTLTMGSLLEECRAVTGSDANLVWVEEKFLLENGAAPWSEIPLWVPASEGAGFSAISCGKAIADGLTFCPLADIIRDTLAWDSTRPASEHPRPGLTPEKEQQLLAAWRNRP